MKAYAAMGLLHAGIAVALRAAGGFTLIGVFPPCASTI